MQNFAQKHLKKDRLKAYQIGSSFLSIEFNSPTKKRISVFMNPSLFNVIIFIVLNTMGWSQVQTFTSSGTSVPPAGASNSGTIIKIECWGGGGGGKRVSSGDTYGGGGGSYSVKTYTVGTNITITGNFTVTVGGGGAGGSTSGTSGGNSIVSGNSVTVTAKGGGGALVNSAGAGGQGAFGDCTGNCDNYWNGGTGSARACCGNGGGGGAGTTANGSNGTTTAGGVGGTGNPNNGTGGWSNSTAPSSNGGGGGGGAYGSTGNGGSGATGFVRITYTVNPAISISASTLDPISSCASTVSNSRSFTVSGSNLTTNLVVTAPSGFEVSKDNSAWSGNGGNVTYTPSSGTVSNTTVYVRMASLSSSPSSGNVACTSTGATTQNVAVSGAVGSMVVWNHASVGGIYGNNGTNWTPTTTYDQWKTCHIAQFAGTGSASEYFFNIGGGSFGSISIGAVEVMNTRTSPIILGNSSATAGTLTLNGGTVNSVANTILRNNSSSLLTFQNTTTGGSSTLGLVLANATNNILNTDGSGGITISSVISGTNKPLSKTGTGGPLTLSGNNTFTGLTTINEGTLKLGVSSSSSLSGPLGTTGAGTVVSSGASIDLNGFSLTSSATEALTLNGTGVSIGGALMNSGAAATWIGTIALGSDASIGGSGDITASGIISGAFNLTKSGSNALTLSNTNTFGGVGKNISIDNGTLIISSFGNNLGNSNNTFSIGSSSSSASLKFSSGTGNVPRAFSIGSAGGTMEYTSTGTVTFDGTGTLNGTLTANCSGSTGDIIFAGALSGSGGININSTTATRVVRFNAANTYSGSTTITSGTLRLGIANAIPSGSNVILNGGKLSSSSTNVGFTTNGTLSLNENSTIELGTSGNYNFGASNAATWTPAKTLTISNWTGTAGSTGSGAKIFIGSNSYGLSTTQLNQITFDGFDTGASILSTGEIVPRLYQFRSKSNGNWSSTASWEQSGDGTNWVNATATPTNNSGIITIRNGHTITVANSVTVDQVIIEAGGILELGSSVTLTINDGSAIDLDISGTFIQTGGTLTNNGQITVQDGGIIRQAKVGEVIPSATWNTGSTCEVTGWQSTIGGGLNQNFYNFTFHCSSWSTTLQSMEPNGMLVNGLFKVSNTGSGKLNLLSGATNRSLTVGSFELSGGQFQLSGSNGDANSTLTVTNNFLVSGGTFYFQDNPTASAGICRLIVGGDFTQSGGTISDDQNTGSVGIYLNGTSAQTITLSGGSLLDYLRTRFGYKTTSGPSAINEVYSNTVSQNTITGANMPAYSGYSSYPTSGSLINDVTINNSSGVTLSSNKTINGTLTLTSGAFTLSNTLTMANNTNIIRTGGSLSASPAFVTSVNVTYGDGSYSSSITTGNELPSSNSVLNNLVVNVSGGVNLNASRTINGTLTLTNGTLAVGANSFSIKGAINRTTGNINASNASAVIVFNGSSSQNIPSSTFTGNINSLTINNASGVILNDNTTVANTLTLTSGLLDMNSKTLTIGTSSANGTISGGSATSYVIAVTDGTNTSKLIHRVNSSSNTQYVFPIGTTTKYTPVQLNLKGGTLSNAHIEVYTKNGMVTGMNSGLSCHLNRSWFVEPTGITSPSYDIQLSFASGDFSGDAGFDLNPIKLSGGVWYKPSGSLLQNGTTQGTSQSTTYSNGSNPSLGSGTVFWNGLSSFSEFGGGGGGQALPVELLSFNANCNNEGFVDLTWQTASEYNSSHFDLERSRNGSEWQVIQTIPAAGNSNELITYQAGDHAHSEIQYYRLNQVDIDGTNKYYNPIAVHCDDSDKEVIQTYPNPSHEGFSVLINNTKNTGEGKISIVDATGAIISEKSITIQDGANVFFINENLTRGIYFIQIENDQHKTKTIKHVVN
jgi:autotransporter-associated beta strand protein